MSVQQHERVITTQLTPESLDDDGINRADWRAKLRRVVVGSDSIAAVLGENHCLVYDLEHHRWYHYQLPNVGRSWVLAQDGARLWGLVGDGKLATLNLRSGEWSVFQHYVNYQSILYAEGDAVIAQCASISAIDVLNLQGDGLRRVLSIPVPHELVTKTITSVFLREESQFILVGEIGEMAQRYAFFRLDWNGQSKMILDVERRSSVLIFPFFVMHGERENELIYVDMRENLMKIRHIDFFKPEWRMNERCWVDFFAFNDSLIIALGLLHSYRYSGQLSIIRVSKEKEPEVLYECSSSERDECFYLLNRARWRLLGRFLTIGEEWSYDLIARQEVCGMPWSTLLRQAVHNETKRQQAVSAKTPSILTQTKESSDVDTFKVFWRTSLYRVEQVADQLNHFRSSISSSWYSPLFVRRQVPTMYLLPRDSSQFRYLLPEPASGWVEATFDEHGRVWACTNHIIAVVDPDKQEGCGFVFPHRLSSEVRAIAAYDNTVAVAGPNKLFVYHYDEARGLLKEMLHWGSGSEIRGIKPDVEERGLWVITRNYKSIYCELKYIPFGNEVSPPREMGRIDMRTTILGDWPEKVCFAYVDDNERTLRYTLNPQKGWHKVPLRNIVQDSDGYLEPISMSSNGDAIFALVKTRDAHCLLIRSQADQVELISALNSSVNSGFTRWGDWLVLRGYVPLVFAQAYVDRAQITDLPKNEGTLFFHLPTNRFYAKPYQPYAITDALRRILGSEARGLLKSPL